MHRMAALLLLFVALIVAGGTSSFAAKRIALVIGNSTYEHATPLRNPKNDAEAVAGLLERLGFEVVKGTDLTDKGFARTIGDFSQMLESGAETAVFFYAGHGLQVHGKNYLVPVDAMLDREASLHFEAVRLSTVLTLMERNHGTNLIFLDACRDNPLARNLARTMGTRSVAIGQGLARVETGVGTLIAYATQPGNVALDGSGNHSPFAAAFLKHAATPGLEIEGLMRQVRRDVIEATGGKQVPWNHSSLTSQFRFNEAPEQQAGDQSTPQPPPQQPSAFDRKALELAFWNSIRDGQNASLYKEYLRRFPDGDFAPIARARIEEMKKEVPEKPDVIASLPKDAVQEPEAEPEKTPGELALALQKELGRLGCNPGHPDGDWGPRSRAALTRFNTHAKLALRTDEPSANALEELKKVTKRVCPLSVVKKRPVVRHKPVARKKTPAPVYVKPRVAAPKKKELPPGCFAANSGNARCDH